MNHSTLQKLLDIEAIRALKARYCRYIDTKQWARLPELFAPDARFEGFGSAPDGSGVDAFVAGVSGRLANCVSVHHCTMPEIVFIDTNTARAVWAMHDLMQWPAGFSPAEAPGSVGFQGYGHYEDSYRRVQERWYIASMRLTRLRVDALPADARDPGRGRLSASSDWLT